MTRIGQQRWLPSGTVTFLLTDVEGSSRLWETNPGQAAAVIDRHRHILAEAIDRHDGALPLEQGEGDSLVAAFERATDGVAAALEAQAGLDAEAWPPGGHVRVRMALHSGEAAPAADGTYAGAVLNRCARLRALAHGGQVVLSEATRDLVVDHLGAEDGLRDLGIHRLRDLSRPEHVWQLTGPGLLDVFPPLRSLDASPNNLPVQLSSFVGRDDDIAFATKLLHETRLLTLTGSGGCGKTRLALRVAAEVIDQFRDGVWWVALAPLSDGELIPTAVAAAMGVRVPPDREPLEMVLSHLAAHEALLGLDNCEHLIGAAAGFIDRLLRAAPHTKVLATSREPMVIEGEVTWRVPSLAVPPETTGEPGVLRQYDAVRLFIERAVQVRPNFSVTNDNAPAVAEICYRLDGIPLAIELAAARTRMFSPEKIAGQLDDRFRLLAGGARTALPRQQTLLASIDWSHDLLDVQERALFRTLGVFASGFTLDAAEAVTPGVDVDRYDVLDVLSQLVNKSLVQLDDVSRTVTEERYRLLETIRHYARDRLEEAGEGPATRDRHLTWATGLAEALEPQATNAHPQALDRLELEHPNLRAALEWGISAGRVADAMRLVGALGTFWTQRGHYAEAQRWMALVDELDPAGAAGRSARAHWAAAHVALYGGDPPRARRLATAALSEAREHGDRDTEARCLLTMGNIVLIDDPATCRTFVSDAAEIASGTGDQWCEAHSLQVLAWSYLNEGRADEAEEALERHRPIYRALNNDIQRAWHHADLGWLAMLRCRFDESQAQFQRALDVVRRVRDPLVELIICASLSFQAVCSGQPQSVAALAAELTGQDREWGAFGGVLIPTVVATSRLLEAPAETAAMLEASGRTLFAMRDISDGTPVLVAAAIAAREAGDAEGCERVAGFALSEARPVQLVASVPLELALGGVALIRGDHAAAEERAHAALSFTSGRSTKTWLADTLDLFGEVRAAAGRWPEACRLLAAGDAFRQATGQCRLPSAQREVDAVFQAARAALDHNFEAVCAEGRRLSAEAAAAQLLRSGDESPPAGLGPTPPGVTSG